MKKIFLTLLTIAIAFSSCNKKEGCTDDKSKNYDSEVKDKNDDGSCTYEGQYTLWFEESWADYYVDEFPISIYNGDTKLATAEYNDFLTTAPECGADGTLSFTIDLGNKKSADFTLDVKNANGDDFYIYSITIDAGDCSYGRL